MATDKARREIRFLRRGEALGYLGEFEGVGVRYKYINLCAYKLEEFVELPEGCNDIVVVGHKNPGVSRMKIEPVGTDVLIDGELTLMYFDTGKLAQRFVKQGYKYISIEY